MTAAHYKGGHHPGNGLGLHYTALPPIVASCPYSDQLLVTRKFWSPGANRPSQAKLPRVVDVGVVDLDLVGLGMGACAEQPCNRADGDISYRSRASATWIHPATTHDAKA